MASSSSSPRNHKKYDVFLSFRGEDTRDNFISHLYSALSQKSITFIDDQLNRGDEISESLLNAIQASSISVIIFSEGYASSRWCLDELVEILRCKREYAQAVIPVFYRVDPSDVRNQRGTFGDSFSKLEERFEENFEKQRTWRSALKEAAGLSGFHSQNVRPDSELVKKVVNHILNRLAEVFPPVSKNQLVGVESRVKKIESLLGAESKDVYTVGIWGIGGIGKTTIAWAVFHKISKNFQGSCFLQNVREESERPGGLACLQQKLLSEVLKDENVIVNIDFNFTRLSRRKVLIVLDDVTNFGQIESIIRSPNWFMAESRIIITTRDQKVLKNWGLKEKDVYEMKALEYDHALQLFSRHAFKQSHPDVGYWKLSSKVMTYAQGVPLALEILGAFLFVRGKEEWDSATKKLEMVPHMEIQKILKISYDGLDDHQQNIFLDIAFFYVGEDKDHVINSLDACGFFPEIGLSVLVDKSLITISAYNIIRMHDLLRDMGREIVRQESPNNPGRRSRLWNDRDICKVLTKNTGTEAIKGISLDMDKVSSEIQIDTCTFSKMTELRVLKFYGCENKCMVSSLEGVPLTEVRYFEWNQCPLKTLNIRAENLVSLKMPGSKVEQLWDDVQDLVNLKEMDLSGSESLTKLPNFSQAQNLEILMLRGCLSLMEMHSSIQNLNNLEVLDLKHCKNLTSLPIGIHSEYLRELKLSGCLKLKNFPKILSSYIYILKLTEVGIQELPSSIECLSKLQALYIWNCSSLQSLPSSLCMLKSLTSLAIIGCENFKRLPDELGNLEYLQVLRVLGTTIGEVPESLGQLASLCKLELRKCSELEYISGSIFKSKSLRCINISNCSNFKGFLEIPFCNIDGSTGIERLAWCNLRLVNCPSLQSLPSSLCMLKSLTSLQIIDCENFKRLPDELGNLEYLHLLRVIGTAIEEVPESLGQLASLSELELRWCSELEYISGSIFKLKSLRGIEISNCSNFKGFLEIPFCNIDGSTGVERLAWCELRLENCSSLQSLPSSLCMLKSLTFLAIIDCENFKRLPDELGNLEALEELIVEGAAIRKLPESLGQLASLNLKLKKCSELEYISGSIFKSKSLRCINISNCSNFKGFLEIPFCNIDGSTGIERIAYCKLRLENCSSLQSLQSSLCMLKSLRSLAIIDCKNFKRLPDELGNLEGLEELIVEGAAIRKVPESLGQLSSLQRMFLSNNRNLQRIPESISHLSKLTWLRISYCERLQTFPDLPRNLDYLDASGCTSPKALSAGLSLISNKLYAHLYNCLKLDPNELREIINVLGEEKLFHGDIGIIKSMYFPGNEIPKWFRHQSMGSSVKTLPPPGRYNKLMGFLFCAVVAFSVPEQHHNSCNLEHNLFVGLGSELDPCRLGRISYVESDHVFLGSYLVNEGYGVEIDPSYGEVSFSFGHPYHRCEECCEVKKCGIEILLDC